MAGGARPAYPVIVERDVEARMRDGVVLRADIARPRARGRFPALLTRTPYGKAVSTHQRSPHEQRPVLF